MKLSELSDTSIARLGWSKFLDLLNELEKIEDPRHPGEYCDRYEITNGKIFEYSPDQKCYLFHSNKIAYKNPYDFLIHRDDEREDNIDTDYEIPHDIGPGD